MQLYAKKDLQAHTAGNCKLGFQNALITDLYIWPELTLESHRVAVLTRGAARCFWPTTRR